MKTLIAAFILISSSLLQAHTNPILNKTDNPPIQKNSFIYPNPADQYVYVQKNESAELISLIGIFNLNGSKLVEMTPDLYDNDLIKINISNLKSGRYIVKVDYLNNTSDTHILFKL